ncbi:MAG TPA: hypothetical protein VE046_18190 [Steroidobacteraceae bacterium]|nr:hypothetical protein [Steroidobacteraceae bacterium]
MKLNGPGLKHAALASLATCAVAGLVNLPGTAVATPAVNFNSEILARSFFEEIQVNTRRHGHDHGHSKGGRDHDDDDDVDENGHLVKIKARDPSDVYVVKNTVPVGGSSGWHTHPGPSVVLVKTGTATIYSGDDPSCSPTTYAAGTGFIDEGGGYLHMVRNEGQVTLELIAFQIVPANATRRIDAADPGFCPF